MLALAVIAALVALVAGAMGWGGAATGAAVVARFLFGIFLAIFVIALLLAAFGIMLSM